MAEGVVVRRRSLGARIAIGIGVALAALLLVIVAAIVGLNTGPGRDFAAARLAGYETQSGISVHARRIEGSLYGRMTLVGLEVRDARGAFLTSPALTVDWRPLAYLHGAIDVRDLSAAEVRLLRRPALKPVPSDPNAPILPDIDLTLAHIAIDRLIVEPPVTGRRHIVTLGGGVALADRRAQAKLDAFALTAPGVAGGDRLALTLDAVPDANRLLLDAKLDTPAGGLVDSYAHLGKPLALSIGGRGDWAAWNGRAIASLAGQPLADLALGARNGTVILKGPLRPDLILTGPAARMTEPAIDLAGQAVLGARKADVTLTARSAAFAADMAGLIDLGASRFGNLRLSATLLTPGAILPNLAGRDVRVAAVLDGPIATPTMDYRATATALAFGTTGVRGLVAAGRATVNADHILVPLHATARAVTGLNPALGGLVTNLRIDGDIAYAKGKILSDDLKLRSDRLDATAIIVADPVKGSYAGALKGRVNDYLVDGLGRIDLTTDAKLAPGARGGFAIVGSVRVMTRKLVNASVADFLGGNALVTANIGYDPAAGLASLHDLRVNAPRFHVPNGDGSYRLRDGAIAFTMNATSADYGPVTLTTTGTAARPLVKLRAARPNLGVGLADVNATLEGAAAGYHIRASGQSAYGPFSADLTVRAGGGPLAVDIAKARFAGVDFAGRLVQTAAGPYAGTLTLAGSGLNGSIRLAAAGKVQRADIDVRAAAARIPGANPITIGSGAITATALLIPGAPSLTGRFALTDVRQGTLLLARAQGRIAYAREQGRIALVANGRASVPFGIALQAETAPNRLVANVRGEANGIAFRLAAPALATARNQVWTLAPARIVVPQGQLDLSGSYARGAASVHAALRNLDIGITQAFLPGLGLGGKASGTVDATLPAGAIPSVTASLDIAGFTRTAALVVSAPVDIATLTTLSSAGGEARALIRRGGAVIGRAAVRLAPIPGGAASWTTRLMGAPLAGGIRYNGPADVLWTLTGIGQQTLSGPIAVAADLGGRLDQPTLTGIVRANALRYENDVYGTVISGIALDGRFTQSALVLNSLTGKAGNGTIAAKGSVGFAAASGFPIDIAVTLANARLARSDALGATVDGTLHITNSKANGALVQGDLRVPEARYEIIRQGAAEVPELTGIRRRNAPVGPPAPREVPSNWKLDIHIRAPNQLFVSGMGLEAEWSTDMRVTGTASAPVVVGKLEVVRGTYSFAGRRFELADDSRVTFNGALLNPELAISASTTVEGVSATINIGGYATRPEITFTSTPTLPQDEVLSRLLFGSSVTSLSPTQALQLAAALNSLRGSGGGGLNPLGKLRSATGLDRLRVLGADKTAGRGTALAAGKYISNNIYVEVVTDARGFTQTQLEISLSRALSLLSATGSFGGSSVNLRYSKDY